MLHSSPPLYLPYRRRLASCQDDSVLVARIMDFEDIPGSDSHGLVSHCRYQAWPQTLLYGFLTYVAECTSLLNLLALVISTTPCCLIMVHMRASSQDVIGHASFHAGGSRAIPLTRAHSHQKPKGKRQTKHSHACSIATKDPNLTYKKATARQFARPGYLPRYSP